MSDLYFTPVVRPDKTLLWLPPAMLSRLGLKKGAKVTKAQMADSELCAMLNSRFIANEGGGRCDIIWHRKNGYL